MKRILQTALGRLGYRIVRIQDGPSPSEGLNPFFASLQKLGFAPKPLALRTRVPAQQQSSSRFRQLL